MIDRLRESPVRMAIVAACCIALAIAFAQSQTVGLADNGDFTRLMQSVVSRPEIQAIDAPRAGTPEYDLRFYTFWIPRWHESLAPREFASTATLLWLPGIILGNVRHPGVVSLPAIAACSKAIIAAGYAIFLIFFVDGLAPTLFFGVTLGLLLSASDYTAYLNSFYSEGASGLYLLFWLLALCALVRRYSVARTAYYLLALTLLSASKLQYAYLWPLGFALMLWIVRDAIAADRPKGIALVALAAVLGIAPIYNLVRHSADLALFAYNDYDRVYDGLLVFADDPETRLPLIGATDPRCIGTIAFEPIGMRCAAQHPASVSSASAFRLLVADPAIVPRAIGFAADSMQDISLEYLGKYERGDPRAIRLPTKGPSSWSSSFQRDFYTQYTAPPWDLWSALKYHLFPRGALLFAYEAAALAFFAFVSVGTNARVLRLAGTSCIVVSFTQMIVDIFGDGREEIIKHLFLANLAFDVSLILAVAYGGAVVLRRVK